jgi:hypothetical protein
MFRLDARWKHFYLKRRVYRHFWTSTAVYNASGAVVTANASLIPGALSIGASIGGVLFNVPVTLLPGNTGISVTAPANTRLNARYRHFWARNRTERHYWAQWEGARISSSLADGDLVVASLALIQEGQVSADAILSGVSLDVILASLVAGEATGDAQAEGALLQVNASVINGELQSDNNLDGQVLPVGVSIISGVAVGDNQSNPAGIGGVRGMPAAFQIPKGSEDARAYGDVVAVGAQLIAGVASVHYDIVPEISKPLPPARASEQHFEAAFLEPLRTSVEAKGAMVGAQFTIISGTVSVHVEAPGAIIEDWLPNDERDIEETLLFAA